MEPKKEKPQPWLEGILLVLGIMAVAYGVAEKNDPVFIVGLLIGIAAYLLIRRRLKASIRDNS
jgi:hypothetical protein